MLFSEQLDVSYQNIPQWYVYWDGCATIHFPKGDKCFLGETQRISDESVISNIGCKILPMRRSSVFPLWDISSWFTVDWSQSSKSPASACQKMEMLDWKNGLICKSTGCFSRSLWLNFQQPHGDPLPSAGLWAHKQTNHPYTLNKKWFLNLELHVYTSMAAKYFTP